MRPVEILDFAYMGTAYRTAYINNYFHRKNPMLFFDGAVAKWHHML